MSWPTEIERDNNLDFNGDFGLGIFSELKAPEDIANW